MEAPPEGKSANECRQTVVSSVGTNWIQLMTTSCTFIKPSKQQESQTAVLLIESPLNLCNGWMLTATFWLEANKLEHPRSSGH